jgi:RNA polymerase sigma factor (sigma-70 family)
MATMAPRSVVRHIESLFDGGSVAGLSDRQLLERYSAERNTAAEAAFAALVTRHGPMVLYVCRQILGDIHHAEDAFQAVFLVLARRARSIRDPDLLGNWLYGVALRTARCARQQIGRRRKKEESEPMNRPGAAWPIVDKPLARPADQQVIDCELADVLHFEIERLPNSFRLPVVLCYFNGLTLDEAARRLHCPPGTLRSRLARARDKLRRGLTRRGVALPAATLAAFLDSKPASASISFQLCEIAAKAATQFAAGNAAAPVATALAHEVFKSTVLHKSKTLAPGFLLLGAVATAAGYLNQSFAMRDDPAKTRRSRHRSRRLAPNHPTMISLLRRRSAIRRRPAG